MQQQHQEEAEEEDGHKVKSTAEVIAVYYKRKWKEEKGRRKQLQKLLLQEQKEREKAEAYYKELIAIKDTELKELRELYATGFKYANAKCSQYRVTHLQGRFRKSPEGKATRCT